ncbi:MAG: DUF5666 domain-containing protein [Gammaproteobacteria bacterium]|nr:DUF5666 domain-containing protein [Gammaproteobacteria bacterium]
MKTFKLILTSCIVPLLVSCGGGSNDTVAEGGIGGTGVSQGKVSGYGSIFVNGIEYDTADTDFDIEEDTVTTYTQDDIKLGMVVRVTAEWNDDGVTGTATKVEYSDLLEGILTAAPALDADGVGTMTVMQQTVQVDPTTVFDDATNSGLLITDLEEEDVVEVSGYSDGSGTIYATRVELKARGWTGQTLEIKGLVSNLDTGAATFTIGSLVVDYSSATSTPENLADGLYVEVEGDSFSATGQFEADEVEVEGDGDLQVSADDEEVELEGVVTTPLSGDTFSLNGQPVSIAEITVDETAISVGRELKVEGVMVNGVIQAEEIEFEADESELQEMASVVEMIFAEDINTGSLTLMGQTIAVTSSTIMEDDLGDDQTFNLASLEPAQYVEIDVYHDGTGLVAVKLEREAVPEPLAHEIEGVVEEINVDSEPDHIRVLGIVIDMAATGLSPSLDQRIEVSGTYDTTDQILTATSAEIEGLDD